MELWGGELSPVPGWAVDAMPRLGQVQDEAPCVVLYLCLLQRMEHSVLGTDQATQLERDRLLERADSLASELTQTLEHSKDHLVLFADWIYPRTGRPVRGPVLEEGHPPGFSDPRAMREVLGFEAEEVGGCAVARHPRWGPNVYPVSVVAAVSKAPVGAQGEEQQPPPFDWKVWMRGLLDRCAAPLATDVPVVWV